MEIICRIVDLDGNVVARDPLNVRVSSRVEAEKYIQTHVAKVFSLHGYVNGGVKTGHVAGRFLVWREIVSKRKTVRDQFSYVRSKKSAVGLARRHAAASRMKYGG